eukprot:jgi/Tetstr1/446199/TSEL_033744.t1
MKVIAKKFRGVWHYGVITGVVTEWVLEDYGGATQWRAVFEDGDIVGLLRSEVSGPGLRAGGTTQLRLYGITRTRPVGVAGSGKVTVQSGWVMEDCLHHMETFSILNAGPLLEEARNVVTEEDGPERKAQVDALTREGRTRYPAAAGAARRQGAAAGAARRQGAAAGAARRQGGGGRGKQRGAKARRPGQRGAKARRRAGGAKARRPGQRGAKTAHTAESAERDALQLWTAAAENYAGRMTEVAVLVSPAESACGGGGAAA